MSERSLEACRVGIRGFPGHFPHPNVRFVVRLELGWPGMDPSMKNPQGP
ncbi:hypothetical protein [Bifidobacterium asteroides]|uniref:Uncharacterized protein n=1 Tax=Bifidobacterium asteroides TaxID=1684 RepID=A0A6N7TUZ0_9BIFI|nr:hypothetical protein [Bifidobacterium asteroides]MSD90507.1 hypothetical protein [Bifidobacterium asteroides]